MPTWRGWAAAILIAAIAGCGSSNQVNELPEAAKKALWQKKVDVPPRSPQAKPSRR